MKFLIHDWFLYSNRCQQPEQYSVNIWICATQCMNFLCSYLNNAHTEHQQNRFYLVYSRILFRHVFPRKFLNVFVHDYAGNIFIKFTFQVLLHSGKAKRKMWIRGDLSSEIDTRIRVPWRMKARARNEPIIMWTHNRTIQSTNHHVYCEQMNHFPFLLFLVPTATPCAVSVHEFNEKRISFEPQISTNRMP